MKSLLAGWLCCLGLLIPAFPQHVVFLIGEREYETSRSLPAFFESELEPEGFTATFITAPPKGEGRNEFPGLENALAGADLCVLSVRRRAPEESQLDAFRAYLEAGNPLVAIRTSNHAFHLRGAEPPDGHALWESFDPEVLGGNYHGHYGREPAAITLAEGAEARDLVDDRAGDLLGREELHLVEVRDRLELAAREEAVLAGVDALPPTSTLYRSGPLAETATPLLLATVEGKPAEPVAWTHRYGPNRAPVFYTSLGLRREFETPEFRRFLVNAIRWALEKSS